MLLYVILLVMLQIPRPTLYAVKCIELFVTSSCSIVIDEGSCFRSDDQPLLMSVIDQ